MLTLPVLPRVGEIVSIIVLEIGCKTGEGLGNKSTVYQK